MFRMFSNLGYLAMYGVELKGPLKCPRRCSVSPETSACERAAWIRSLRA